MFREDLERFPDNGWSLGGLAAALAGQGKAQKRDRVEARLREVWRTADVPPPTGG